MPKVSVVIPTYNRAGFVGKAIESVLGQTFRDYEIIVIDDGSTDDTRAALASYSSSIKYIFQENAGVSVARNVGVREARGAWIAFLDSDDEWSPNYLCAQTMQMKQFPEAVGHIANGVTVSLDGNRRNLFDETGFSKRFKGRSHLALERPLRVIVEHGCWFTPSFIARREVLLEVGLYDEELSIAEDLDLVARIAVRGPIAFCNEELVEVYRRKETTVNLMAESRKRELVRCKSFGKVFAGLLNVSGLDSTERAVVARALSATRLALGNVLIVAGRKAEGRQAYREAFNCYPSWRSAIKYAVAFIPGKISQSLVMRGKDVVPGE